MATKNPISEETKSTATSTENISVRTTPLNHPGHWKGPIISHSRRSGDAVAIANETYHEHKLLGFDPWLDVRMADTSEPAMQEGAENSCGCLAIITGKCKNNDRPQDPPEGNAYFCRTLCVKEIRWSIAAGKKITCIVRAEDRHKLDELFSYAPDDLKYLQDHVIYFDRNDRDYQQIAVRRLLIANNLPSPPSSFDQTTIETNDTPPKVQGGVHWATVFDSADVHSTALVQTVTGSLTKRGYIVGGTETEDHDDDKEPETKVSTSETKTNPTENNSLAAADALLVVLSDHTFSSTSTCATIRTARSRKIP